MSLTVRVSGRAEFNQIKREVRDLDYNFLGLRNTVKQAFGQDFITAEQSRHVQFFMNELKKSERDLNSILDEQRTKINKLERTQKVAVGQHKRDIQDEIKQRQELLEAHEKELEMVLKKSRELEDLSRTIEKGEKQYPGIPQEHLQQPQQIPTAPQVPQGESQQQQPAPVQPAPQGYSSTQPSQPQSAPPTTTSQETGGNWGGMQSILNLGKKALGILGVAGVTTYARQGLVANAERQRTISDLGMRLGADTREDFENYRRDIRDAGMPYGYDALESYQMVDTYSQRAGAITIEDQQAMQGFSRAFGLSANQVATTFAEITRFGGSQPSEQRELAEALATAIERGGMQERAVEAMEVTAGLLGDLSRTIPNVSAQGILALQTLLNQTGEEALRGERGGDLLSSLNDMIVGGATDTAGESFILRALGWGTDKSYYEARLQAEKGISDEGNLPAILSYLQTTVSSTDYQDMILSNLANMSVSMAKLFREETDNYQDVSTENVQKYFPTSGEQSIIDERMTVREQSLGHSIQLIDTQLAEEIAKIGNGMTEDFLAMKGITADMLSGFTEALDSDESGGGDGVLGDLLSKTTTLIGAITALTGAITIARVGSLVSGGGGGGGGFNFPGIPTIPTNGGGTGGGRFGIPNPGKLPLILGGIVSVASGIDAYLDESKNDETGKFADVSTGIGAGAGSALGLGAGYVGGALLAPYTLGLSTWLLPALGHWIGTNVGASSGRKFGTWVEDKSTPDPEMQEQLTNLSDFARDVYDSLGLTGTEIEHIGDRLRQEGIGATKDFDVSSELWQELKSQDKPLEEAFKDWVSDEVAYKQFLDDWFRDNRGITNPVPYMYNSNAPGVPTKEEFLNTQREDEADPQQGIPYLVPEEPQQPSVGIPYLVPEEPQQPSVGIPYLVPEEPTQQREYGSSIFPGDISQFMYLTDASTSEPQNTIPEEVQQQVGQKIASAERRVVDMNVNLNVSGTELNTLQLDTMYNAFKDIAREVFKQSKQDELLINPAIRVFG